MSLVKYLLFFFNLIFWIASVGLIAVGVAVLTNLKPIVDLIPNVYLDHIPTSLIVVGSAIFIVSFSGCFGAIKESGCLLITYAIFMIILAAAKSYLAYVLFSNLKNIPNIVEKCLKYVFNHQLDQFHVLVEYVFKCCGPTGAADYTNPLPAMCCPKPENNTCDPGSAYRGCTPVLSEFLDPYAKIAGYVVVGVIVLEVLAIAAALSLNNDTKKTQKHY